MKIVYTTKDAYKNNTVRVNYFEKDAILLYDEAQINEKTLQQEIVTKEHIYDKLLFCERLEWAENENELNDVIEQTRKSWEDRVNISDIYILK